MRKGGGGGGGEGCGKKWSDDAHTITQYPVCAVSVLII